MRASTTIQAEYRALAVLAEREFDRRVAGQLISTLLPLAIAASNLDRALSLELWAIESHVATPVLLEDVA